MQRFVLLCALFVLVGCDRSAPPTKVTARFTTNAFMPEAISFETPEAKERREVSREAGALLSASKFDELDARAAELRALKDSYPDGYRKLGVFCSGLDVPDEASEARYTARLAQLRAWVEAKPKSMSAHVCLARALTSYAWKARGSGYADTVSQQGWRLFRQRLADSHQVLLTAKDLPPCPLWFSSMQTVALGEGWPRAVYEAHFEAAIKHDPDYMPFYYLKAQHLLPRWYGGEGEWEDFIEAEAKRRGGEEGDLFYARMVWNKHSARLFGNIFKEAGLSWSRTKRGFQELRKRYPDSLAVQSEFCYLSGLAGDHRAMQTLFLEIGGKVDETVWLDKKRFLQDRKWAFGL
jgi:uncharacterized protein DUF4034